MRLSDLASRLGVPVEGDGSVEVRRASGLDEAGPGDLSFVRDAKYAAKVATTKASALILPPGIGAGSVPVLRSPAPDLHFLQAVMALHPRVRPPAGIHATAVIDPTARIGAGASVGPYVVVEADVSIGARAEIGPHVVIRRGVTIGDDAWVHARVVIREGCRIGHRVILQDGAVIGCDGFGFARRPDGTHQKIPQVGIVVIEDDVEIQANACVDRATLDVAAARHADACRVHDGWAHRDLARHRRPRPAACRRSRS
jgi:UDP-3-O-[3-hydroxymyristoyl] glucosamine N-acyltransferase